MLRGIFFTYIVIGVLSYMDTICRVLVEKMGLRTEISCIPRENIGFGNVL